MVFDIHRFTQATYHVWPCFWFRCRCTMNAMLESTFVNGPNVVRFDWTQGSTVQAFPIVHTNFALFFAHWVGEIQFRRPE